MEPVASRKAQLAWYVRCETFPREKVPVAEKWSTYVRLLPVTETNHPGNQTLPLRWYFLLTRIGDRGHYIQHAVTCNEFAYLPNE